MLGYYCCSLCHSAVSQYESTNNVMHNTLSYRLQLFCSLVLLPHYQQRNGLVFRSSPLRSVRFGLIPMSSHIEPVFRAFLLAARYQNG